MLENKMVNSDKGKIYLSGGMQFADNLGAGWRIATSTMLRKHGYVPLDITELDKAYTAQYGQLYFKEETGEENRLRFKSNVRQHFVHADLKLIEEDSDAVIVYYDESVRKGAGTISEAQVTYNLDIPLF